MRKKVYNLRFPPAGLCGSEINIYGYRFTRVKDYDNKIDELEGNCKNTITAYVDIPESEGKAVLDWEKDYTALKDITFLLSIFTRYEVYAVEENTISIAANPRQSTGGKELEVSVLRPGNFETNINKVYSLIRTKEWQNKYQKGWFLFLAQQALRGPYIEFTFLQCWTIWEHLFAILNRSWLSDEDIRKLFSYEKIAFLLVKYGLVDEIDNPKKRIKPLTDTRNRLIHHGRFPEGDSYVEKAILFIDFTEFILAKILELKPAHESQTITKIKALLSST